MGERAQERAPAEQADRDHEDAARPETVGHPAADGDEHGHGEGVAHHGQLHGQRRTVKAAGDVRKRGVQDCGVKGLHEEGRRRDGGQPGHFFQGETHCRAAFAERGTSGRRPRIRERRIIAEKEAAPSGQPRSWERGWRKNVFRNLPVFAPKSKR